MPGVQVVVPRLQDGESNSAYIPNRLPLPKISTGASKDEPLGTSAEIVSRTESDEGDIYYKVSLEDDKVSTVRLEEILDFVSPYELERYENQTFDEQKELEQISDVVTDEETDTPLAEHLGHEDVDGNTMMSSLVSPLRKRRKKDTVIERQSNIQVVIPRRFSPTVGRDLEKSETPTPEIVITHHDRDMRLGETSPKKPLAESRPRSSRSSSRSTTSSTTYNKFRVPTSKSTTFQNTASDRRRSSRTSSQSTADTATFNKFAIAPAITTAPGRHNAQQEMRAAPDNANDMKQTDHVPEDDPEYEIEAVVNDAIVGSGKRIYRIKWLGFSAEDNTWESEDTLDGALDILEEYWIEKGDHKKAKLVRSRRQDSG